MRFTIILLSLTLAGCESADVGQIGAMLSGFGNGVQQHEPNSQSLPDMPLVDQGVQGELRYCHYSYSSTLEPVVVMLPSHRSCSAYL